MSHSPSPGLKAFGTSSKKGGTAPSFGSINLLPEPPPLRDPTSRRYLERACTEFHPGSQYLAVSDEGGWPSNPSIVKERGESGSSGGPGSWTLTWAVIAVLPLKRWGCRGIFIPFIRNVAGGAASVTAPRVS